MAKKHDIGYIKSLFKSKGVELLDEIYVSYNSPLRFKCACGNEHKTSTYNLTRGKIHCPSCYRIKRGESIKIPKEEIFAFIESKGYKIKSQEYNKVTDKLNLVCPKGHEVSVSVRSFKQNEGRCRKCLFEDKVGESHPSFKHGRSKEDRLNRNLCKVEHNKWKRAILSKFGYRCAICGKQDGRRLCAHHLNGYNWDVENRYNIDNGIILCKEHHDGFHKVYGKGDNTIAQFNQFLESLRINNNPWHSEYLYE
jgi:hypothetical protein